VNKRGMSIELCISFWGIGNIFGYLFPTGGVLTTVLGLGRECARGDVFREFFQREVWDFSQLSNIMGGMVKARMGGIVLMGKRPVLKGGGGRGAY